MTESVFLLGEEKDNQILIRIATSSVTGTLTYPWCSPILNTYYAFGKQLSISCTSYSLWLLSQRLLISYNFCHSVYCVLPMSDIYQ